MYYYQADERGILNCVKSDIAPNHPRQIATDKPYPDAFLILVDGQVHFFSEDAEGKIVVGEKAEVIGGGA